MGLKILIFYLNFQILIIKFKMHFNVKKKVVYIEVVEIHPSPLLISVLTQNNIIILDFKTNTHHCIQKMTLIFQFITFF